MATSLARPLETLAEKASPELAEKAGQFFGSMDRFFQPDHPKWGAQDKVLQEAAHEYHRQINVHQAGFNADYKAVTDTINDFPDLKAKHGGTNQTTLQDIHTDIQNHPDSKARAATQNTFSLMSRHATNPGRTLQELSNRAPYASRAAAQEAVLGRNNKNITPMFYQILQMGTHDQEAITHADQLADVFSRITQDKTESMGYGKIDPITGKPQYKQGAVSRTKKDIEKWVEETNKFKSPQDRAAALSNVNPVYNAPGKFERDVTRFTYRVVTPWIALPHLGQFFNLGADVFRNLGRTALALTDSGFRQSLMDYGITASTQHSIMNEAINWEKGKVAQVVGSNAARIIGKFVYNPGFHPMRLGQLMLGGATGYHALERMGEDAAAGDAGAIENLRRLHLDPQAIVARGGKLEDGEFGKGIYHFVNDRFFIDKTLSRSVKSGSNIYLRNMSMFHTFVTYQASFMQKEIARLFKTKDLVGIAHFAATVGILFPMVAPMIKSAEALTRTADWDKSKESAKEDYAAMLSRDSSMTDRLLKWGELMSYIGAMGVFHSFWKAAEGHRLAQSVSLLNPMVSAGADEVQDIYDWIKGTSEGEHHYQRAIRQALRYTVPVAGGPIGSKFFPTPKD